MELKLKLDRSDKRYAAGDVVRCTFYLKLTKELQTRFISMRFLGIGTTDFETFDIKRKGCYQTAVSTETYGGYEEYFRHYKYFIGAKGALETTLAAGDYEYTESYELPPNLPCSYEGDHGSVKYLVRVKIDNNWTSDKMVAESFIVESLHSNKRPDLDQQSSPQAMELSKEFYFQSYLLKRMSRPVKIATTLPKNAFRINDTIQLGVHIDNKSVVRIKHFSIKLEECVTFSGKKNENVHSIDSSGNASLKKSFTASPGNATTTLIADNNHTNAINLNGTTHSINSTDGRHDVEETTANRVLWSRLFPIKIRKRTSQQFVVDVPLEEQFGFLNLTGSKLMRVEYLLRVVGVVNRFHMDPEVVLKVRIDTSSATSDKSSK